MRQRRQLPLFELFHRPLLPERVFEICLQLFQRVHDPVELRKFCPLHIKIKRLRADLFSGGGELLQLFTQFAGMSDGDKHKVGKDQKKQQHKKEKFGVRKDVPQAGGCEHGDETVRDNDILRICLKAEIDVGALPPYARRFAGEGEFGGSFERIVLQSGAQKGTAPVKNGVIGSGGDILRRDGTMAVEGGAPGGDSALRSVGGRDDMKADGCGEKACPQNAGADERQEGMRQKCHKKAV